MRTDSSLGTGEPDYVVVGGGIVGLSVGFGLLQAGYRVTLIDETDTAIRASRGNFGLIWVQGKGVSLPAYASWTQHSAGLWPEFARVIEDLSATTLSLEQRGGFSYYLSENELAEAESSYTTLATQLDAPYPFEVLTPAELRREEPQVGGRVVGAILHHQDGHVNPLKLLVGLSIAFRQLGGRVINGKKVDTIQVSGDGVRLSHQGQQLCAGGEVVLCAGLGARALGKQLGFNAPVRAQRGHILITEKLPPLMRRPSDVIRQVDEGGVQIGATAEEVGPDDRETLDMSVKLAAEAITLFPALSNANLVRSWAALRIMSPDGYPIYQQSPTYNRAWFVTCHSAVTLCAAHAMTLPLWMTSSAGSPDLTPFSEHRFTDTP